MNLRLGIQNQSKYLHQYWRADNKGDLDFYVFLTQLTYQVIKINENINFSRYENQIQNSGQFRTLFRYLEKDWQDKKLIYSKVASTSPSRFETHIGLFRLLMKEIFDAYVL